jgi:hypothetical protein
MARRIGALLLLLATALGSSVLVARLPPDLETTVVTRRHHGADPLLSAAVLRFGVASLLHHPTRYFHPPFLYPDPNPLRGTEPLLAEAMLALPFRLVLGDRPAPLYTWVKIASLALFALATALLLRELGVHLGLCVLAGGLGVMLGTTTIFVDRLQAVSLQWLPLSILFALRFWRRGRGVDAAAFAATLFLTVQASLYTTVMLLGVAPFLLPLLRAMWSDAGRRRRAGGLVVGGAVAAALCVLVLWSYVADRADVSAYSSAAYASEKSWGQAALSDLILSPPEYAPGRFRLAPASSPQGAYPGTAFVLLVGCVLGLTLADRVRARGAAPRRGAEAGSVGSRRTLALLFAALALTVALGVATGANTATRLVTTVALWGALVAWWWRLARWPVPASGDSLLRLVASTALFAALVLFLLGLGSPVRFHYLDGPLFEGLFRPLSLALPPLREMRELKRCLLPAGWAALLGATIALELRLRGRPRSLAPLLAAVLIALAVAERVDADTRKAFAPPVPSPYQLLSRSGRRGGLLELPFDGWGGIASVHRMLWQPSHGRPIVAGRTGIDPAWYAPAWHVLNAFPSQESLLLLRAWGIDSVLDARGGEEPAWPEGVELRGRVAAGGVEWRLLDVLPRGDRDGRLEEPPVPDGTWERPSPAASQEQEAAMLATDGSLDTSGEVVSPDGLLVTPPGGGILLAVEIDYGSGRFGRIPSRLRVLGREGDEWRDLTEPPTGEFLRARAADQLLHLRRARLVVRLLPGRADELRLEAPESPWDLPELRVRVAPEKPAGISAW